MKPFRIIKIKNYINSEKINILEVGAGSHSPSITKKYYQESIYHGIDISKNYNYSEEDILLMDKFFEMDLTKLNFDEIPDDNYDLIIMSHIIEHLHNGNRVIEGLINKLKSGGIIYIEYPSERSVKLPSMKETLNFYDDPTHCRIFSRTEIRNILENINCNVLEDGIRRHKINILLMPIKIVHQLITLRYIKGGVFWDFYGMADYVIGKKK